MVLIGREDFPARHYNQNDGNDQQDQRYSLNVLERLVFKLIVILHVLAYRTQRDSAQDEEGETSNKNNVFEIVHFCFLFV